MPLLLETLRSGKPEMLDYLLHLNPAMSPANHIAEITLDQILTPETSVDFLALLRGTYSGLKWGAEFATRAIALNRADLFDYAVAKGLPVMQEVAGLALAAGWV